MKIFFLGCLLLFVSCSPYQKYYHYDYLPQSAKRIKSVLISPVELIREIPKGADPEKIRRLNRAIELYVKENGFTVVSNEQFVSNWTNQSKAAGGFFDASTGKINAAKIARYLGYALEDTKRNQKFDAFIDAQIIERPARLMGDRVYWDGSFRSIFDERGDKVIDVSWRGEPDALSLLIVVFGASNSVVFKSIGALEFPRVLKEMDNGQVLAWKDSLQFNKDEIEEAVKIAFHPFIKFDKYPQEPNFYETEEEINAK